MRNRLFRYMTLVVLGVLAFAAPAVWAAEAMARRDPSAVVCARHLKAMGRALTAYRQKRGGLPRYLSDLYPGFLVDQTALSCPADRTGGSEGLQGIQPDPVPISYLYEMSLAPRPPGWLLGPPGGPITTWRDIKLANRAQFGARVPVATCWHHARRGYKLYLTLNGQVYTSTANWEIDPATVAVVLTRLERDLTAGPSWFRRRWWPHAVAWYCFPMRGWTPEALRPRYLANAERLARLAQSDAAPDNGDLWSAAGSLYYVGGDREQAIASLNHAIRRPGRHRATPFLLLASIYREAGRVDRATELLRKMPALDREELSWVQAVRSIYSWTGRQGQGESWYAWAFEATGRSVRRQVLSVLVGVLVVLVGIMAAVLGGIYAIWRRSSRPGAGISAPSFDLSTPDGPA